MSNISIVQNPILGGVAGNNFNDVETVGNYPNKLAISPVHPITEVRVRHGEVIDGFDLTYKTVDGGLKRVNHGTSEVGHTQGGLAQDIVTLGDNEVVTSIMGRAGQSEDWGERVVTLGFIIYNTYTGATRIAGPYGTGTTGNPFFAGGLTPLIGLGGNAVNTDLPIGRLPAGQLGGLYGLSPISALSRTASSS